MPQAIYNIRILCVFFAFALCFTVLGFWLYHLQVSRHEHLTAEAKRVYTDTYTIEGRRGNIYDAEGNLLATTEFCKDIFLIPDRIHPDKFDDTIDRICRFLKTDKERILELVERGRKEIVLKRGVALIRAEALRNQELPGVRFVSSQKRFYPNGGLACHLIGFTNKDGLRIYGAYGIEQKLNKELTQQRKTISRERTRKNKSLIYKTPEERQPLDGNSVYLTIQEPLQFYVESELEKLVEKHKPRYAYAVMADPKTGAILAMAQAPNFNLNDRSTMNPDHWINHAASDVMDPGSTMKAISILGALHYKVVTPGTIIDCEAGNWYYGGRLLRDAGHSYGRIPVWKVIQKSSNIGTAKIARYHLGEERLDVTFRRFGFGQRTGVGVSHESPGIYRPLKKWDTLSVTRFPIGQGISVTTFQMIQAYCAIANKGRMMQLHLVDKVMNPSTGELVYKHEPKIKRVVARPEAVKQMVDALKTVVTPEGTARRAMIDGYEVAGKTGTSQKFINGSYENGRYIASFAGFAPADNPAFVLMIVADEPSGGSYYGGTVCGPSFKAIGSQTLRHLNVMPKVADSQ